jgi:hypothetical protein
MSDDALDIVLGSANATDPELAVRPVDRHAGGDDADIAGGKVFLRIGRRPTAHSLRALYELSGRTYPATLSLDSAYRVWLVAITVSVIRYDGFDDAKFVGLELKFADEPRVTIQGLAPQTEFADVLKVDSESRVSVAAEIGLRGSIDVADAGTTILAAAGIPLSADANAKFTAATKTDIVGRLSMNVVSPIVQAVGVGDYHCEWSVKRHRKPLIGDNVFIVTVLVPKHVERLTFEARVSASVTTFDLLIRQLRSAWIPLECTVPRDKKRIAQGT